MHLLGMLSCQHPCSSEGRARSLPFSSLEEVIYFGLIILKMEIKVILGQQDSLDKIILKDLRV
jgi:hypothetical protein